MNALPPCVHRNKAACTCRVTSVGIVSGTERDGERRRGRGRRRRRRGGVLSPPYPSFFVYIYLYLFFFLFFLQRNRGTGKWLTHTHMNGAGIVVRGDDADAFTSSILGGEFPQRHALNRRSRSPVHRVDRLVGKVPTKKTTLQMQRKSRGKMMN